MLNRLCRRRSSPREGGPKRAQDEPRWPQDGPKTARGWPQDGQKTTPRRTREAAGRYHKYQNWHLVSARCEFCKVGYASSVFRNRKPEMAQDRRGMTSRWPRDGPRRPQDARDGPRWPQDDPKMTPRCSQTGPRRTPKLASRVGEVRILQNRLCRHRFTLQEGPKWL